MVHTSRRSAMLTAVDRDPIVKMMAEEIRGLRALVDQMSIDTVTSLPNRGALDIELGNRQSRVSRGEGFAVLFIDIDHFKQVNDEKGHAHGDDVLRQVAKAMRSDIRPHDFVGRYGGEEFVVVISAKGTHDAAERIRASVESQTEVTVSIGVCFWGTLPLKLVLDRADAALYEAKTSGRNRIVYTDKDWRHNG